jgi:hypothetical protein
MLAMSFKKGVPISRFLGRNGCFSCSGFVFEKVNFSYRSFIRVYPKTSRGFRARCFIEIPIEEVKRFSRNLLKESRSEGL